MRAIQRIRNATLAEELDYGLIMSCLQDYQAPRDVISRLLNSDDLIRVKKGIYVFSENFSRRPYSLEILSNMIYGPSYVSCEYALSHYGFIPEAVNEITCMTTGRNKRYETPVGIFTYRHLAVAKYQIGITYIEVANGVSALFASPEKALADLLFKRKEKTGDVTELKKILTDDYRIDSSSIQQLRLTLIKNIAKVYRNKTINLLPTIIGELQNG